MKLNNPWSGEELEVRLIKSKYATKERMYLGLQYFDEEYNEWMPWSDITVNLPDALLTDESSAYIDVNNNPGIERFILENELGTPTGMVARSGFVVYPEFVMSKKAIEEAVELFEEIMRVD